mmetsp:Transcript_83162/g.184719  ORF Transcript_83162/g.184719 Transcript_83162/m.184719 type:complete len:251 (+) Transcript_83162:316-1068(+)
MWSESRGRPHRRVKAATSHVRVVGEVLIRRDLVILGGQTLGGNRGRTSAPPRSSLIADVRTAALLLIAPTPVDAEQEHARMPQAVGVEGEEGLEAGFLELLLVIRCRLRIHAQAILHRKCSAWAMWPEARDELPHNGRANASDFPEGALEHRHKGVHGRIGIPRQQGPQGSLARRVPLRLLGEGRCVEAKDVASSLHRRQKEDDLRMFRLAFLQPLLRGLLLLPRKGGEILGGPQGVLHCEEGCPCDEGR